MSERSDRRNRASCSIPAASAAPASRTRRRSRGIALITVLWFVLLLSVIAGSLVMLTRSELGLSRNLVQSARAQALAEGGIYLAVHAMLDAGSGPRWVADGRYRQFELEEGLLDVSIQDATGLIDLNAAAPELLTGLFVSAGVPAADAASLADRVMDWRDADDEARPNGAEQSDYDAAGLDLLVGNGPLLTPDEIQRIPGVSLAVWDRIAPLVTVYSRRPGVNPTTAPRAVLLAIPGMDEAITDEIIQARSAPDLDGETGIATWFQLIPGAARRYLTGGVASIYVIEARASLSDGGKYVQEAVVELNPGANPPWRVHAWRPGTRFEDPAGAGS